MNVFASFDEIPKRILQDIKETKRYGHTFGRSVGRTDVQRENSIPSHKFSLPGWGGGITIMTGLIKLPFLNHCD